jgi:ProP effector
VVIRERLGLAAAAAAPPAAAPPDEAHPRATVRQLLAERYPAAFSQPRPLKVGVAQDIRGEILSMSRRAIRGFFRKYCKDAAYLRLLVEGVPRVDLRGQPCGTVTAAEAEFAAERLRKITDGGAP